METGFSEFLTDNVITDKKDLRYEMTKKMCSFSSKLTDIFQQLSTIVWIEFFRNETLCVQYKEHLLNEGKMPNEILNKMSLRD